MSIGSDLGAPSKYGRKQTAERGQYMVPFVLGGWGTGGKIRGSDLTLICMSHLNLHLDIS